MGVFSWKNYFGSDLQKNCSFLFGFAKNCGFFVRLGFYKINCVFYFQFFCTVCWSISSISVPEMTYFSANCLPKWLRTISTEMWNEENTLSLWLLILLWWKINCKWDNVKRGSQTVKVIFFENWTVEAAFSLWTLNPVRLNSLFRKPMSGIFVVFHALLIIQCNTIQYNILKTYIAQLYKNVQGHW